MLALFKVGSLAKTTRLAAYCYRLRSLANVLLVIPSRVQMCHFELGTRGQGDKGTRGQGDKGERKLLLGMQLGIKSSFTWLVDIAF